MVITVETARFYLTRFDAFQLKLTRRLVVVDKTGVLSDWRLQCETPTLLKKKSPTNAPDPALESRLPLKSYSEIIRTLSILLVRRYMVFHDCEAVLDSLQLALPLKRTTDISLNIHVRNDALRSGGSCWCRSRRHLVEMEKLWQRLIGARVPADPIARAHGILRMFNRAV